MTLFHFSFVVGNLSTDLQCYFGCDESFKKDYQLHLHLKLKHRNEDPKELEKAYEAAEEEIGKSNFQFKISPLDGTQLEVDVFPA